MADFLQHALVALAVFAACAWLGWRARKSLRQGAKPGCGCDGCGAKGKARKPAP